MARLKLVLHNIRSTYNVGAILRTAEGFGAEKVVYSGYTPRYEDARILPHLREKINHQIAKSAVGAELIITQESVENLPKWMAEQRGNGWKIIGLENNLSDKETARKIILDRNFCPPAEKLVLVLGEEVAGIPAEIRDEMDYFLEIPMRGQKESFNVSVATGIAIWGILG